MYYYFLLSLTVAEVEVNLWRDDMAQLGWPGHNVAFFRFRLGVIRELSLLLFGSLPAPRVFVWVLRFSSLQKNQHLQIPSRPEKYVCDNRKFLYT